MSDVTGQFWSIPPVTRTLLASAFALSLLIHGQIINPYPYFFSRSELWKFPPELWRMVTPFIITNGGLGFFIDLYLLWKYGTDLELESPRFSMPGDYCVYAMFCSIIILSFLAVAVPGNEGDHPCGACKSVIRKTVKGFVCGAGMVAVPTELADPFALAGFWLQGAAFLGSLLLAFMYTYGQDNRGKKTGFFFIQIPVELLAWASLLLTFVSSGPYKAMIDGTGILAAYTYDFLTRLYPTFQGGKNYLKTPVAIRQYFAGSESTFTTKKYGRTYRPADPSTRDTLSTGWTSSFSNNWNGRGAGRRLGSD